MIEANRYKLGLFVIIGFFLLLGMLFFLGLSSAFQRKATLVSLFRESIQGLDVGSPVKFKGVPIGKVSKISIRTKDKLIRVDMEVLLSVFEKDTDMKDKSDSLAFLSDFLRKEIKSGLRCQLVYLGITGMKFVEIDYYNIDKITDIPEDIDLPVDSVYIPSTPSLFGDMLKVLNESLAKISKIKFEEISEELAGTIKATRKLLEDPKLSSAVSKLDQITGNLEKLTNNISKTVTEEKIKEITDEISDTLKSVKSLVNEAKAQIKQARLPETSEQFRNASSSISESRKNILNTLMKLDKTLDSITEFVNYLDEDPSSLLKGKHKPETLDILREQEKRKNSEIKDRQEEK